MSVVTVVFNGQAQLVDPFNAPIANRLSLQFSQWWSVQDIKVEPRYSLFSFYYDYQATLRADTRNLPADVASVVEKTKLASYLATGFVASAVAVTSAGQQAPTQTEEGVVDSFAKWPKAIADFGLSLMGALNVTATTAKAILIAIGLGIIALIYFIATQPASAARIARG